MAGTEVIYDESSAPWSLAPREWVHQARATEVAEGSAEDAERPSLPRSRRSGTA